MEQDCSKGEQNSFVLKEMIPEDQEKVVPKADRSTVERIRLDLGRVNHYEHSQFCQ